MAAVVQNSNHEKTTSEIPHDELRSIKQTSSINITKNRNEILPENTNTNTLSLQSCDQCEYQTDNPNSLKKHIFSKHQMEEKTTSENLKIGARRCGECEGCKRQNCGKCIYCKDSKRFGGPNKMKQACKERICVNKNYSKNPIKPKIENSTTKTSNTKKLSLQSCGQCEYQTDNPKSLKGHIGK